MSSDKKSKKISDTWNSMLAKVNLGKNVMKIDTLLGQSAKIRGDFYMTGNVKIDGKINGEVKINGDLIVGETSEIKGDITADNVIIAGTVNGNITAKGQLTIKSSANVNGEHSAKSIAVEEGSAFVGNCKILGIKTDSPDPCTQPEEIEEPEIKELQPPPTEE